MHLVGAQRRDDEHRQGWQPTAEVRDDLEAQLVAPVQVFQGEQHRSVIGHRGERVRGAQHQEPPPAVCVSRVLRRRGHVLEPRHQPLPERRDVGADGTGENVAEIEEQTRGELDVLGERTRGPQRETLRARQFLDRMQEPGLADAGLAGQQQEVAPPPAHLGQPTLREGEQIVPAEHRLGADVRGHRDLSIGIRTRRHVTLSGIRQMTDAGRPGSLNAS